VSDVFFDDLAGRWAVYMRGSLPDSGIAAYARIEVPRDGLARPFPVLPGTRAAERGRAVDLRGEAPFVFQTDADDPVGSHVYTLYAHRYGWADAAYVAFPSIWYSRRPSLGGLGDPSASDGMEMQFAFSRDGIAWRRPLRRSIIPAWLEAGPAGVDQVYCGGMVRRGDEVIVYYSRVAGRHLLDDWKPLGRLASIGRVVFRLDGFVSADATEAGGELTTPVLDFEGRRLELNAWTGAGGVDRGRAPRRERTAVAGVRPPAGSPARRQLRAPRCRLEARERRRRVCGTAGARPDRAARRQAVRAAVCAVTHARDVFSHRETPSRNRARLLDRPSGAGA
jgi:hypothetical protein